MLFRSYTDKSWKITEICVLCKSKAGIYNLDVSTQENISSGGARQLNMMISLDIGNSYALRCAADAPGSVRMN